MSRRALQLFANHSPSRCEDRVESNSLVIEHGTLVERDYSVFFHRHLQDGGSGDLKIHEEGVDNCGAEQIALQVKENSQVKTLNLALNSLGDKGATALCSALLVNTSFRGLNLYKNRVGGAGFISMTSQLLAFNQSLCFLSLGSNAVFSSPASVDAGSNERAALRKLVSGESGLRYLGLSETGLGDEGCEVIGNALPSQHCTLKFLHLARNQISEKGVSAMCSGLEKNTTIQYVDFSCNQISNEGAETIRRCAEVRARQGFPLLQVWMQGNLADVKLYSGCMVNGEFRYFRISTVIKQYLD